MDVACKHRIRAEVILAKWYLHTNIVTVVNQTIGRALSIHTTTYLANSDLINYRSGMLWSSYDYVDMPLSYPKYVPLSYVHWNGPH